MNTGLVSAVIPTLDEAAVLPRTLAGLSDQDGLRDLVVVDGGSRDATMGVVDATRGVFDQRGIELTCFTAREGRADQMNAGAGRATGAILLFLHADTVLPEGAVPAVVEAIRSGNLGGAFRHRFIETGLPLAAISCWANWRSRLTHVFFGDQAIFIRKDEFDRMGGFRPMPIMEDLEFTRRLRRRGRTRLLPMNVRTSARRFVSSGMAATCARMFWLRAAYRLGADPARLKRYYPVVR